MAKNITPRKKDFPQWYQDVIQAGQLADHSPVKGCMVIRPDGYGIWEQMQQELDTKFKETGHVNAYFPVLIPESFITKEADHVDGFAPELAVVTHAGGKELEENLVVRPTSETIIGHMYSKWIQSYRELPVLINQWCSVLRWEKRTRLFLRTSEFLWQEGHTAHETAEEAEIETLKMLEIYRHFLEHTCAIPVIPGEKPTHEKFPGAAHTYTVEAMMQDKKALQSATSHNLGQNFSKAFDIQFLARDNQMEYAWTTSWGASTRMIGGLIMTHGDDDGLIIPPRLAAVQVVIVPIFKSDEDKNRVFDHADTIARRLREHFGLLKIKVDYRENLRPGDKFFTWIQKGVPLRIEVGPRDVEKNGGVLVRRDNREKTICSVEEMVDIVSDTLESIQNALFDKALQFRKDNSHEVESFDEFKQVLKEKGGFIYAHWDRTAESAEKIQELTKATIRLIPTDSHNEPGACIITGNPSKGKVLFGLSY
ncbi:MAG: proline--tRNA ligase [Proteobacteria bacterium]|nr:proline--tRNA ligase [Pseudomonadota bacterium]